MVRCVWSAGDSFSYPRGKIFPMSAACQHVCFEYAQDRTFFFIIPFAFLWIGASLDFSTEWYSKYYWNNTSYSSYFIDNLVTESFLKDGNKKAAEKKVLCLIAWLGITEALFYLIYFYNCYSCLRGEANRCIVQFQVQLYMRLLRQVKLSALLNTVRHT